MERLIERTDVERVCGAAAIDRWCDDDGDGIAEAENVEECLDAASDRAGVLLGQWPEASVVELVTNDRAVRRALAEIAAGLMGRRRAEWANDQGRFPSDAYLARGEDTLKRIFKDLERAAGSVGVGPPGMATSSANVSPSAARDPFMRATTDYPTGRGGF